MRKEKNSNPCEKNQTLALKQNINPSEKQKKHRFGEKKLFHNNKQNSVDIRNQTKPF